MMNKTKLFTIALLCIGFSSFAQFGAGLSYGGDIYGRWTNPVVEGESNARSVGSALINTYLGPKIWVGGKKFNVSVEGHAHFAPLAFDTKENKGLGAVNFPIMGMLNFKGAGAMSAFDWGYSLGGGVMYTRTELYAHNSDFDNVTRDFFPTYFGQINIGMGVNGQFNGLYIRYGVGPNKSKSFDIGILTDYNFIFKQKNRAKGKKEVEKIEQQDKEII